MECDSVALECDPVALEYDSVALEYDSVSTVTKSSKHKGVMRIVPLTSVAVLDMPYKPDMPNINLYTFPTKPTQIFWVQGGVRV